MLFGICPCTSRVANFSYTYMIKYCDSMIIVEPWIPLKTSENFLMFSGKSKGSLERNKYSLQKYPLSKNYYPKFNNFLLYLSPFSFLVKEYPESMFIQSFQYGTKAALDNEKVHMYMLCIFCFFLLYYCSKVKTTFQLKVFAKYSVENHLFKLCDRLL